MFLGRASDRRARVADPTGDLLRRQRWRRARRFLIIALCLVAIIEVAGVPYLRVQYTYTGPASHKRFISGQYLGVTGMQRIPAGRYGEGCPVIVFVPLEKSLVRRAGDLFSDAWSYVRIWSQETFLWHGS